MFTVTKTTQGAYTAYVLADTGAGTTATVVPEKGGMVTSFTKNGDEYSWLREPNFSQPERPALRHARAVSHVRARAAGREHLRRQKLSYDHPRHRPLHALAGGGDGRDGRRIRHRARHGQRRNAGELSFCVQRYHPVCAQGRRAAL